MSLRDDLIAAKALIDTPEKWRHGYFLNGDAMCALRALETVAGSADFYTLPTYAALCRALPADWLAQWGPESAGVYNDRSAHADIMSLFDRAIASAQHEGHGETETWA